MHIRIDDKFIIKSDGLNFVLTRLVGSEGKEQEKACGYYQKLTSLLDGYAKFAVMESESTSFKQLRKDIKKIQDRIDEIYQEVVVECRTQ